MLKEYKGNVTVKIDGIAASAASVIAMAGDTVLMSPVAMLMIHNPATIAYGDHAEMQKAIDMLAEVKESIINAYVLKTGLSRSKLSHLMDAETWMDANKAVELGFADDIIKKDNETIEDRQGVNNTFLFSTRSVNNALLNKLEKHYGFENKEPIKQAEIPKSTNEDGTKAEDLRKRLDLIKKYI